MDGLQDKNYNFVYDFLFNKLFIKTHLNLMLESILAIYENHYLLSTKHKANPYHTDLHNMITHESKYKYNIYKIRKLIIVETLTTY